MRLHQGRLKQCRTPQEHHRTLVELNVVEQCLNLYKTAAVQKQRLLTSKTDSGYQFLFPQIHGVVYDPGEGILRKVHSNISHEISLKQSARVYDLFESPQILKDQLKRHEERQKKLEKVDAEAAARERDLLKA